MNFDGLFAPYAPPLTHLVDRLRYWATVQPDEVAFYFTDDSTGETKLTYRQLEQQARAIATQLHASQCAGQRALLLYPPGLDFVTGFFGCLFAGAVAVPVYPPRRNRKMDRLEAICADADATVVLTTGAVVERVSKLLGNVPQLSRLPSLCTDQLAPVDGDRWQPPRIAEGDLAVLQYTSGSTGSPKGVMLTHANLMHNCAVITHGFQHDRKTVGLSWLPTYHDMGLVGGVLNPVFVGRPNVLMSPMAFLQKPIRWLRGITRFGVTVSGGPNFAYDLCNARIPLADCEELDLSTWRVAYNGAEPIRAATLQRFTEKFAPFGFRPQTHYPCYGMAETTLILTGGRQSERPVVCRVDADALEQHRAVEVNAGCQKVRQLVGSGRVLPDMKLVVVDVDTRQQLPDGHIGEIWAAGPSVAQGYWNKPEETSHTFVNRLGGSHNGAFMRTGDLGFISDGQLFVTGRSNDLIIIRGRNLYPQDVEFTVEQSHAALQIGCCAALSADCDDREELVIVAEVGRQYQRDNLQAVVDSIQTAILDEHDVAPHTILLLKATKLPKTSSGKVQRAACREDFLTGKLDALIEWTRHPAPADQPKTATVARNETTAQTRDAIQNWLITRIARHMQTSPAAMDVSEPLTRSGMDSVALVQMSGELEEWLGHEVSPTLLFSYPTIASLANHLASFGSAAGLQPATAIPWGETTRPSAHEPIAIVGLGCRYPGADNPEAFWRLLHDGVDAIREIDTSRWDVDAYYAADPDQTGKSYARHAGLLERVDLFDPQFFGIAPREAASMDPQQRLLLEVTWEALEHAGQSAARLAGSLTGVFVGISNSDYARVQSRTSVETIDAHTGTGTLNSVAAGRLAYQLGLHGPCLAVDTACSSSLVAVHLAVESLRDDRCQAALAGGVNLILDPASMIALSRLRALAPDGRCKTFDAAADGYGRGEGCGMVLLKRLTDAQRDGDRILAVIRGSAVNHDGRSNGLTAPHRPAQEEVIRAALTDGDIAPAAVSYLEAHGTGTLLGDPIEVRAAASVYGAGRRGDTPLAIGSVKTNIGHLESAAGIAGLMKIVLALQNGTLPAHLHLENPNPYIPWDELPIKIVSKTEAWTPVEGRRIAGISSFGFSGTNAHLVVEGVDQPSTDQLSKQQRPLQVLPLSAASDAALTQLAEQYADYLARQDTSLADVCFTAATGRSPLSHRLAIVTRDRSQAQHSLATVAHSASDPLVYRGVVHSQYSAKLAMLFTGQGSQYVGMGRQLYQTQPTFRRAIDRCAELLRDELDIPLLSVLYPSSGEPELVDQTAYTQPALFSIAYALYELWQQWGIRPAMVLGHSLGEYMAAWAAGVFSLEDALRLVAARGRLMQALPATGMMVSMAAGEEVARAAILGHENDVAIAAVNGPHQTVISGDKQKLTHIAQKLSAQNIRAVPLPVSHGFHSPQMDAILDPFAETCATVSFSPPSLPFVSSVYGHVVSEQLCASAYWVQQIRQTVRFVEALGELDRLGADVYLEVGAKPILIAAGQSCLDTKDFIWLPSLRPQREDWATMSASLASLYVRGLPVDWDGFDQDEHRRKVALPTYPFQRQRCWLEATGPPPSDGKPAPATGHSEKASHADMQEALFELCWQPKSRWDQNLLRPHANLTPTTRVTAAVHSQVERLLNQLALPRYQQLDRELDRQSAAYVRHAMTRLGWCPKTGQQFSPVELADRLGVLESHRQLWHRMLAILTEEGLLAQTANGFCVTDEFALTDPDQLFENLRTQFPECTAELTLLAECGPALADVLTGQADPLEVLFPSGSSAMVEKLYRDSPFARTLNALVEETLAAAIAGRQDRPLKILEIGAGTGGTTAQLLHRLSADHTEYLFTDVSEIFTRTASRRFNEFPFVRFGLLDIETTPRQQGFADHQFDVIIAANVLHATTHLRATLQHIKQLLAPAGALILAETTRRQRWLDLVFGLTDGWWRFADRELRRDHPLLEPGKWAQLLTSCGFENAVALPESLPHTSDCPPHAVLLAQSPAYIQLLSPNPTSDPPASEDPGAPWLILADRRGIADRLAEELANRGQRCVRLYAGRQRRQLAKDQFEIEPAKSADYAHVFEKSDAFAGGHGCQGVVHLWSLDSEAISPLTAELLQELQTSVTASVPVLLGALSRMNGGDEARSWFVTRGAQPVRGELSESGLAQSPLVGLARVVSQESPAAWGGMIDLDPQASKATSCQHILAEILDPDDEDQLAYRNGQRFAARLSQRRSLPAAVPLRCPADASYLITGGLGDLGLQVALWLADRGARNLILTGRTVPQLSPPDESQDNSRPTRRFETIQALEQRGVAVRTASADVADAAQMGRLLEELRLQGCPPVRGIVHCAGIADAAPILELDPARIDTALRAKVQGTWILHRLSSEMSLDFFIAFSSGATMLGSPMLGSYAAANAFLDAIAHYRHSRKQTALTVNWGFWDEVGMVSRSQREIGRGFAPRGMQSFSPAQGLQTLEDLLMRKATQTAVMPVNWHEWCAFHPRAAKSPLLRNVMNQEATTDSSAAAEPASAHRQRILAAPSAQRLELLEQHLSEQLGRVLRMPAMELDVEQPLNNLGIDSLMAVEFRNQIELQLQAVIPVASLLQGPSIRQLASGLLAQLTGDSTIPTMSPELTANNVDRPIAKQTSHARRSAGEILARLDELSDSEVDSMLGQMLDQSEGKTG